MRSDAEARPAIRTGFCHFSAVLDVICNASVGQISTHAVQLTQSLGRGIHGRPADMARQSVGQMATQAAEPVQRVSSKIGRLGITATPPPPK